MLLKDADCGLQATVMRFEMFLEAQGRSPKTIKTYDERLRNFVEFLSYSQNNLCVQEISPDDLDAYVVHLRRKNMSPASIAGYVQAVKAFFRWCVKRGYVTTDPAAHLQKPRVDRSAKSRAISDDDFRAMLEFARSSGRVMETAILLFLMDTGCRAGELCALNVEDIDLDKQEARTVGKTGVRILDFTDITAEALRCWLNKRNAPQTMALFVDSGGKRLNIYELYGRLRTIARRASVQRHFNPHAFRHRVGQGWIDQGANLELVRLKLGHKDIQTTSMYYANQDRERQKRATERYSLVKDI